MEPFIILFPKKLNNIKTDFRGTLSDGFFVLADSNIQEKVNKIGSLKYLSVYPKEKIRF